MRKLDDARACTSANRFVSGKRIHEAGKLDVCLGLLSVKKFELVRTQPID